MAVTIFSPSNVFRTLSAIPFEETAPMARGLLSSVVEFQGFSQFNNNNPLVLPGFTVDVPGIPSRPIQLALENILLLGTLAGQFETKLMETRDGFVQVQEQLQNAINNIDPDLRNEADNFIDSAIMAQLLAAAEEVGLLDNGLIESSEPVADPLFTDFTQRPTETNVFGSTYSGVTVEGGLGSTFLTGVSLSEGDEIFLSDLLIGSQSASAAHYVVSIQNEFGTTAQAEILDAADSPVANGTIITAAELSTFKIRADSGGNGALDYFSIIELRDPEGDAIIEGRGAYRTVAINSGPAIEDGAGGEDSSEQLRNFTFYTESGVAYTQIRLQFSGVNSLGHTDALSAIQAGDLRVKIGEELIDGSINIGQVDQSQSSLDTIVIVFPFQAIEEGFSQNGLDVEIRALDVGFDVSTITVRADFP